MSDDSGITIRVRLHAKLDDLRAAIAETVGEVGEKVNTALDDLSALIDQVQAEIDERQSQDDAAEVKEIRNMRDEVVGTYDDTDPYVALEEVREVKMGSLSVIVDFCELLENHSESAALELIGKLKDLLE